MSTKNSFFTVDFEDFRYDFLNKRGLTTKRSPDGLHQSYAAIKEVLEKQNGNKKCTFFCTGNVAEHSPELIKQISDDGHEIACHSNEHKDVSKQSNYEFERDIEKAINSLSKASNLEIKGYRAPMFSLHKDDIQKYKILAKYFVYDSSLICTSKELPKFIQKNKIHKLNLYEFPIIEMKNFPVNLKMIGGTYLKITPTSKIKKWFLNEIYSEYMPIIYMHPYEFLLEKPFWVSFSELKNLNFFKNIYFQIRQHQWHSFNRLNIDKLSCLLENFPNKGPLEQNLKIKNT